MNPDSTALPPISSPTEALAPYFAGINGGAVVSIIAALLFIVWVLYSVVAAYHLIRYGYRSAIPIPAILVHVAVSIALALYAVSGLH